MAFPVSPVDGQIYKEFIYNESTQAWESNLDELVSNLDDNSNQLSNLYKSNGIIIPLYLYPTDIYNNTTYNDLIDLLKLYSSIPIVIVLNPNSGPGTTTDGNYSTAIKRLQGAGAIVIGYVSTDYTTRLSGFVTLDIDKWLELYPNIDGIFFDEMTSDDNQTHFDYYKNLNDFASSKQLSMTVGNCGTSFNHGYHDNDCADVIIGWENSSYPSLVQAKEDWAGGAADYSVRKRGVLIHTQTSFNEAEFDQLKKYYGWIYITEDVMPNPWDTVSTHMETMLEELSPAGMPDLDPDGTLSANSDEIIASQKAVKTYVDTEIGSHDAEHDDRFVQLTDYEDQDVLDKIKNVDGTGTELDADKIDGADLETTLTDSDTKVSSSAAVKTYVDTEIENLDKANQNYIKTKITKFTSSPWVLTEETTSPIDIEGTIKATLTSGTSADTGFYQDYDISDLDKNSLLQLSFYFKDNLSNLDEVSVQVLDTDDSNTVIFESTLLKNTTYNSINEIYYYNNLIATTNNDSYRFRIKTNTSTTSNISIMFSTFFIGQVNKFTAPSTGDLVGQIQTFPTYKDRTADDLLPFAFDNAVSQTEYSELYAEVGNIYEIEHTDAGDDPSGAGMFYPTPIPGAYNRVGYPDIVFDEASVVDNAGRIAINDSSITNAIRKGSAYRIVVESGTLSGDLSEDTIYFMRSGTGYLVFYNNEADAIAATSAISYTDSGSGTFRLTQEGISLDDAAISQDIERIAATEIARNRVVASGSDFNVLGSDSSGDSDYQTIGTSNETRPTTYITYGYIRYRSVRSVELMKSQTNRDDAGGFYYDPEAPTSGINRMKDLAFDGVTIHSWSTYDQLNSVKSRLIAADLFEASPDPTGATFKLKAISPAMGWKTVWEGTSSSVSNIWELGKYLVDARFGATESSMTFMLDITDTGIGFYSQTWGSSTNVGDQLTVSYNHSTPSFVYQGSGVYSTGSIKKIHKLEEIGYAYLRTKSLSQVILAEIFDDTFYEHEITDTTDVIYTLANLNTKKEYTFNRYGSGTGVLTLTGDVYWPDGEHSTDFALEGNGQITIKYAGSKWRVVQFTDSGSDDTSNSSCEIFWEKELNGKLIQHGVDLYTNAGTNNYFIGSNLLLPLEFYSVPEYTATYNRLHGGTDQVSVASYMDTPTLTRVRFEARKLNGASFSGTSISVSWRAVGRFRA